MFILLLVSGVVSAGKLDDCADNQATLTDSPNTANSLTSWQTLTVADGLAGFRRLFVNGGLNGDPGNVTSVGVASRALTLGFGHEPGLSDQVAIVAWSDQDISPIWAGSLDLSAFDAMVLDMGLVTQSVVVVLTLKEKASTNSHDEFIIDNFGQKVFALADFDTIDRSQVDIINLRVGSAQSATGDGIANFNSV